MRLTTDEIAGIKAGAAAHFGAPVPVRLFGSRIDDAKKGGDIDLLIEVPPGRDTFMDEIRCIGSIQDRIGERKVDVLLVEPGRALSPIERIAYRDGVLLDDAAPAACAAGEEAVMSTESWTLADTVAVADRVGARLRESVTDLAPSFPIAATEVGKLEPGLQLRIDAFLKRFEQLQDVLSNRLVRAFLIEMGDEVTSFSARDAFDRAESLGALDDAARFFDIAKLRNRLVHEYPMEDARRAKRINDAFAAAKVLLEEHERLAAAARRVAGGAG
jgi:predicted nucleotidyltransferase